MTDIQIIGFYIPCEHEHVDGKDVPDYQPLRPGQVVDLLETARAYKANGENYPCTQGISRIQVRLRSGIPGMTCPRPIEGPVAEQETALHSACVNWITDPETLSAPKLTEESEIVKTLLGFMCAVGSTAE